MSELPQWQLKMLIRVYNSQRWYGEPTPCRTVRDYHVLSKLRAKHLVYLSNYQGEECFGITEWGAEIAKRFAK